MCSRGVFQLRKLSIFFCDFGGSSGGVRDLITSNNFKEFMSANPQIEFNFICKRNNHPYVRGAYINGYIKDVPLRNCKDNEIENVFKQMRNQFGTKAWKANGPRVYGAIESIQGKWKPNLFNKYPIAELQKTHDIPDIPNEYVEKEKVNYPKGRKVDLAKRMVQIKETFDPHRS